jgi:hypothetical protein
MKIEERIKEVDLRPSDIVKLQRASESKEVSLSQATGWIKAPVATKAIEQLLWRLCDEKVEQGLSFDRPGRKKEVVAEIFSDNKRIIAIGAEAIDKKVVEIKQKISAKKVEEEPIPVTPAMSRMDEFGQMDSAPSPLVAPEFTDAELEAIIPINGPAKSATYPLQSTGLPSWGLDRTYKIIGSMLKLNYNGLAYKLLNVGKLDKKGVFVIEGVSHDVSGFTEV